ncbi:SET domain-containing protein [Galbibacter mesophilus]|uniref:SET domain-containing protein n=1 Tax=Galbibacter mesophilus TaxID=379069 RepID=UPI00191D5B23|nr:SET domain-containing protein [Galbibacter mesophilus]MCM5662699.1 SET domain-containing protein [Galbibacter mesophilus]
MIHPHTELRFISDEIGHGVVATKLIPKGTITWVQDQLDLVLSPAQVNNMSEDYQKIIEYYTFRNNKGDYVLCWDLAKFVNHSFKSNCLTTPYDFEIAIRDIYPGEELTDDYGYLNIEKPFKAKDEGTDRKIVYPDDLLNYHKMWDESLQQAFIHINAVNQPLANFLSSKMQQKINKIDKGETALDSILMCYYEGK